MVSRIPQAPEEPHRTYVLAHAHPDDETLATGAVLLGLRGRGDETYVLTATRGEKGEVVPGALDRYAAGTPLVEVREAELGSAVAVLGVHGHAYLGRPPARAEGLAPRRYEDSGMRWVTPTVAGPGEDAGPESLTSADVAEVAGDIAAYAAAVGATDLVSYADDGGYGHPDHVRMHEATRAAAVQLGLPFWIIVSEQAEGDDWFDAADRQALDAAHHAYATQFTLEGDTVTHVGGQSTPIVLAAGLRRQGGPRR